MIRMIRLFPNQRRICVIRKHMAGDLLAMLRQ
ncbi:MAG: hypothetical protein ACI8Z0_003048, partial [Lentimonas sp.]